MGEAPDTADPGCSSLTLPLRISHPNLNHVGLRREEKRGETEDREGGDGCVCGGGGRKERVWEQRARGKGAGPKRHAFQRSASPAPNSAPLGRFPALQELEQLRLLVAPGCLGDSRLCREFPAELALAEIARGGAQEPLPMNGTPP